FKDEQTDTEDEQTGFKDEQTDTEDEQTGFKDEDEQTRTEGYEDGNVSEEKAENSSPASNRSSKSGQGLALLAQLGTLLAITLSLL
ncbi:MAG: hypothetical protein ACOC9A_00975, partial [Candidatus Bipolaricaulota bacterium]